MTKDDYLKEVREVLATLQPQALDQIKACLSKLPSQTTAVSFLIFVDQDGEGALDVRISLDGPDLAILASLISDQSTIVSTRHTPDGFLPPFPLMDPFEDLGFSIHDALTDETALWIQVLWSELGPPGSSMPVGILSPDGHGKMLPLALK
jgi:hypothetical protein